MSEKRINFRKCQQCYNLKIPSYSWAKICADCINENSKEKTEEMMPCNICGQDCTDSICKTCYECYKKEEKNVTKEQQTTVREKAQMLSEWAINKNYITSFRQLNNGTFEVNINKISVILVQSEPNITVSADTSFYLDEINEIVQKLFEIYKDNKYV